jgi:hypothetical protein
MKYIEGEWLRGPVPLAQALALADQILTRSTPRTERASSTAT